MHVQSYRVLRAQGDQIPCDAGEVLLEDEIKEQAGHTLQLQADGILDLADWPSWALPYRRQTERWSPH
jgi:hypothetical protein